MTVTNSTTMIASAADRDAVNAYFDSLNWGSNTLSVPLSPDGQLPVTHYGAHDMQTAEVTATLLAAQASADPLLDALNTLFIRAVESTSETFTETIAGEGDGNDIVSVLGTTLQVYYPPYEM
jgi:hypothetical protein